MPTREEWTRVHADLMAKLHLPCRLRFSTEVKIGQHVKMFEDYTEHFEGCWITINPEVDFRVPEHLILHEAAHHRANDTDEWHGHDELWAGILCDMYRETEIALPQTTSFIAFAKAAGITRKNYAEEI